MIDLNLFRDLPLRGGFVLKQVRVSPEPLVDPIGRPALARAVIIGHAIEIELGAVISDREISISLDHEVLEAVAVAMSAPPGPVQSMNEADFEAAAQRAHVEFGPASPATVNRLLEMHGFVS